MVSTTTAKNKFPNVEHTSLIDGCEEIVGKVIEITIKVIAYVFVLLYAEMQYFIVMSLYSCPTNQ